MNTTCRSYVLRARLVVPIDRPPLDGGCVTIEGEHVVGLGSRPPGGLPVIDLGDVALLPGLINAHTHLEFSHLLQPLGRPGMSLPEWIRLVIQNRSARDPNSQDAIPAGLCESRQSGVVMIADIATCSVEAYDDGQPCPETVLLHEVIGFSRARAGAALRDVEARLDQAEQAPHLRRPSPWTRCGLSPHAPYTVSPTLLERLIDLATARSLPVAMHLAESPEELELLEHGSGPFRELLEERSMWDDAAIPRGRRPMDYLRALRSAPRSLVVHGTFLRADELRLLGENRARMTLAFCPRTHAFFEHETSPLRAALANGVRVVLGTDSRASNPDLSIWSEMKYLFESCPVVAPEKILAMATREAAVALGVQGMFGTIAQGKSSRLAAIDLPTPVGKEPLATLLSADGQASLVNPMASEKRGD